MSNTHIELGRWGEKTAVHFLKRKGYVITQLNYKTRLGQIDIIARDKKVLCFIEVKTRSSRRFGSPAEGVTDLKKRKISQVALGYLKQKGLLKKPARFDVVAIIGSEKYPEIQLIKNAFNLGNEYLY